MKIFLLMVCFIAIASALASRDLRSCGSCGMECENACGTRNFKTCCFNYMKKRSSLPLALDPSLRFDLWLAKARLPLYQRFLQKAALEDDTSLTDAEDANRILQQ